MAHSQLYDFDSPKPINLPEYVVYQELSPEIQLLKVPNGKYAGRYGSNVDVRKRSDDFCYILFKYQDQNDNKL